MYLYIHRKRQLNLNVNFVAIHFKTALMFLSYSILMIIPEDVVQIKCLKIVPKEKILLHEKCMLVSSDYSMWVSIFRASNKNSSFNLQYVLYSCIQSYRAIEVHRMISYLDRIGVF